MLEWLNSLSLGANSRVLPPVARACVHPSEGYIFIKKEEISSIREIATSILVNGAGKINGFSRCHKQGCGIGIDLWFLRVRSWRLNPAIPKDNSIEINNSLPIPSHFGRARF
jgi:hypothetical protein